MGNAYEKIILCIIMLSMLMTACAAGGTNSTGTEETEIRTTAETESATDAVTMPETGEPTTAIVLEDEGKELSSAELMQSVVLGRHSFVYASDNISLHFGAVTNIREFLASMSDPREIHGFKELILIVI